MWSDLYDWQFQSFCSFQEQYKCKINAHLYLWCFPPVEWPWQVFSFPCFGILSLPTQSLACQLSNTHTLLWSIIITLLVVSLIQFLSVLSFYTVFTKLLSFIHNFSWRCMCVLWAPIIDFHLCNLFAHRLQFILVCSVFYFRPAHSYR